MPRGLQTAPDHRAPDAFDGLRRRLTRERISTDGLRPGARTYAEGVAYREGVAAAEREAAAIVDRIAARAAAAATAGLPLAERIGRAPSR